MYISKIKITNFRVFKDIELELNKGLNVLVGENNSGKTALIDAIRYALGTNSNDRAYIGEEDFHDDSTEITIQITFSEVDNHAHRFVEHLSHEEDGQGGRKSVLHVRLKAEKTAEEHRGYPKIKTEIKTGVDGNGMSLESEIRDFLSATYLKPLRDTKNDMSAGRKSRLSQILSSSSDIKDGMDEILKIVGEANNQLLIGYKTSQEAAKNIGNNVNTPLQKAAKNIQDNYLHKLIFQQDIGQLGVFVDIAGVKEENLESLNGKEKSRYLRQVLEGLSLSLSKDSRLHGLGYHNLLFMGAEMLLLEQENQNAFPLLLIEEPEAHLHPQLQMKLLQFIDLKVETAGVQCFLTTHSPNISSKASPEDIIMLNNGKAFSFRKKETEADSNDYKYLEKHLDATKANIFFAKGILLVEGTAENILLPTIAKLLNRPLEDYGVSIVQCHNSGSWKRFAKLFLRQGKDSNTDKQNPVKIAVLRDLDLWPNCAEEDVGDYGFKEKIQAVDKIGTKKAIKGNLKYWLTEYDGASLNDYKENLIDGLERQNIKVYISNDWTFEFCLAKYGLYDECCKVLGVEDKDKPSDCFDEDCKATFIMKKVKDDKGDFVYNMANELEEKLEKKIKKSIENIGNQAEKSEMKKTIRLKYAQELKDKLPSYIIEAIEYVTAPLDVEGAGDEG